MRQQKTPEELRRLMDLRRSNAASAIQSKKKYNRQSERKMLELLKKEREERE